MAETHKLSRNPIVVVLGHVDHGKTSLLDAIRNTTVQLGEPGGITQNIYISNVLWQGQQITFVDTPGHELFSLMRVNGGKVADIALLIVAADEGVKPQTLECIDIIQSNKMKYIVVITKIDKEDANVEKVKNELMSRGVYLEGNGGDVPFVEVSAVKKTNLDKLLDLIFLYTDVENLLDEENERLKLMETYGDVAEKITTHGVILDSEVDKALGKTAFAVLRLGKLKRGDQVLIGPNKEKIGLLFDSNKKSITEVTAGMAFIMTGLTELPTSGIDMVNDDPVVASAVEKKYTLPEQKAAVSSQDLLASLFSNEHEVVIPIVLRTDVNASLLSILPSFDKFTNDQVLLKVVSSGVGAITMNDVDNARTFKALLLGFRVKAPNSVLDYAKQQGVTIYTFDIVYHLYDLLRDYIQKQTNAGAEGATVIGTARVKKVFVLSDGEVVAGCVITDGEAKRSATARVVRGAEQIGEFPIKSIKVLKEERNEVKKGTECGIDIGVGVDIKEEDIVTFLAK